jgi:hypothetical protein
MVCGLQLNFKIDLQLGGEELFGEEGIPLLLDLTNCCRDWWVFVGCPTQNYAPPTDSTTSFKPL